MVRSYLASPALFAALFLGAAAFPTSLVAQRSAGIHPGNTSAQSNAAKDLPSPTVGPRNAAAGIVRPTHESAFDLPRRGYDVAHRGDGSNFLLVGLGAAAIVTGAIIGGSGGTGVMVVGASVGIYGLYHLLR